MSAAAGNRKVETVTVPGWPGNRDAGRTFQITEMTALRAEKWAMSLIFALKGTTAEIPADVAALGMVGVAIRGINSVLRADVEAEKLFPLLDEMLTCVRIVRDPAHPDVATNLLPDDIQEVATLAWLRSEVLRVHTNFSLAEAVWKLISAIAGPPTSPST